jgi:UDP-2,4-diacetamido-2,4,6-trideoxy-beta-L-altropyranose hydrolase
MENKTDILIYTEGGHKLGLGNIYRSISLANALKERGRGNIKFITSSCKYVVELITKNGYLPLLFKKKELLDEVIKLEPKVLVTDYLGLDEKFTKKIKDKTNSRIVIIGNNTGANKHANVVINAIIGTNFENKKYLKNGILYLEGPKYLSLRDEFINKRQKYHYRRKLEKILLLFGGTDQSNFTCKVLEDILKYNGQYIITLIIGAGYKYDKELKKIISNFPHADISLYKNISDVSNFMLKSDFVITSAGTALFEAFCLEIPSFGLFQNSSQEKIFRNFFMTKNYYTIENIGEFMEHVYKDYDNFNKKIALINAGGGKEEIISNILKL